MSLLPPRTIREKLRLRLALPVFAEAVSTVPDPDDVEDHTPLVPLLCDVFLDQEHDAECRDAAERSVHSLLTGYRGGCDPCGSLIQRKLTPAAAAACQPWDPSKFARTLRLIAAVGASAACRGGASATAADGAIMFLARMACAEDALDIGDRIVVSEDLRPVAAVAAGHAFGIYFGAESGGPFWRQRAS